MSTVPQSNVAHDPSGEAAWSAWLAERSQSARDELVVMYTPLVRMVAAMTFKHRYSEELEYADYAQFGMVGLLEAIDRFDPGRGLKFETFASHRVRGAILNGVESLSEKQQQISVRRSVRAERARSLCDGERLGQASGRKDALKELADVAIGVALGLMLDNGGMYLDGEPSSSDTPYHRIELAQMRERVVVLVQQLPTQERHVIRSHYFQGMQFDAIARGMGLTKGRISQIHHAGLKRLRELHAVNERFTMAV